MRVNDIIFVDMIIPRVKNGSPYSSVLLVMDGWIFALREGFYVKVQERRRTEGTPEKLNKVTRATHAHEVHQTIKRDFNDQNTRQKHFVRQVLTDMDKSSVLEQWRLSIPKMA